MRCGELVRDKPKEAKEDVNAHLHTLKVNILYMDNIYCGKEEYHVENMFYVLTVYCQAKVLANNCLAIYISTKIKACIHAENGDNALI